VARGGGRSGGRGVARLGDLPHLVGLFAALSPPDIAASYRSFCERVLPGAQSFVATWSHIREAPHTSSPHTAGRSSSPRSWSASFAT
jgi:hypothetical protein